MEQPRHKVHASIEKTLQLKPYEPIRVEVSIEEVLDDDMPKVDRDQELQKMLNRCEKLVDEKLREARARNAFKPGDKL
jgi:hypothetical protein